MNELATDLSSIEDEATSQDGGETTSHESLGTESHVGLIAAPMSERERIQSQLEQLKQRESELRRELAIAEHPDLADAIRQIEGRAYGVRRVEAKIAQGLSKSEQRKKETLEKKLATAMERRAEIDAQITALEAELLPLGQGRMTAFETERVEALLRLAALLEEHEAKIAAANLDLGSLIPSLASWSDDLAALRSSR